MSVTGFIVTFLLGLIVGYAVKSLTSKKRYDGVLEISARDSSKIYQLQIDVEPEMLADQNSILFKVVHKTDEPEPEDIPSEWAGM